MVVLNPIGSMDGIFTYMNGENGYIQGEMAG